MDIKPKIVLKEKGKTANLGLDKFMATLRWKTAADLDLHVFYETKDGKNGQVYYGSKSAKHTGVGINLDGDAGVGNTVSGVAGGGSEQYNEENVRFTDCSNIKYAVIVANIFGGGQKFSSLGGHIVVGENNANTAPEIEVPLDSDKKAKWCIISLIDFSGIAPQLKNINAVTETKPTVAMVTGNVIPEVKEGGGGFLSRMMGN